MSYRPYAAIIAAASTAQSVNYQLTNNSGSPIDTITPVTLDSNGDISMINVSSESDALRTIGVTSSSILNATQGNVIGLGKIENVSGFAVNDIIYVSKAGVLSNVAPDIGVGGFLSGDFVIRIGKIAKNQTNPSNKDLLIQISVIGQL